MNPLKRLFRPADVEIWRRLEQEAGARFEKGDFWHRDKIEIEHDGWLILLDSYFSPANNSEYTRMRAKLPVQADFRFLITREGILSEIAKFFGAQDIEVGDPDFDRQFMIKGNNEKLIKEMLQNAKIKKLLLAQPEVHFALTPENELLFAVPVIIKDLHRLKQLFDLFAETLHFICETDT
jgi:hypothetical protein